MKVIRAAALLLLAAGTAFALGTRFGLVPPLGKFLDPATGFWQNGRGTDELPTMLTLADLQDTVHVVWDDRQIPHIFAHNKHDLYFAQGYLTARARLWQMDFVPRAAAGRLSEVIGSSTLAYDIHQRRIGMLWGALKDTAGMLADSLSGPAIRAYTEGVNAYRTSLEPDQLPVEFKMLDYEPEEFTVLSIALVLKSFQQTLTYNNSDLALSYSWRTMDSAAFQMLYPAHSPFPEPVIPSGTPWDFEPVELTQPPPLPFRPKGPTVGNSDLTTNDQLPAGPPVVGSNNWVVSGSRSATGRPFLANDMHLSLGLPSVWYECQLTAPGINVYGVAPPGMPGVVVGFNTHLAWGVTNGQSDVTDWYRIEFRDEKREQYFFDGEYLFITRRAEEIHVRGRDPYLDTVLYTHHGPISYLADEVPYNEATPTDCALRWVAHDKSNETQSILRLNAATDYNKFRSALTELDCPALNFAYADRRGQIAMIHQGKIPLRHPWQGATLVDGTTSATDWNQWIPRGQVPQVLNPEQGFASSANQNPVDETYPYWLGTDWPNTDRAARINEMLSTWQNVELKDMIAAQTDVHNAHARRVLPVMLKAISRDTLKDAAYSAYDQLSNWSFQHTPDVIATRIFTYWWWWMTRSLWEDDAKSQDPPLAWISRDVVEELLLHDPRSHYWDDLTTPDVLETRKMILAQSFKKALDDLTESFGPLSDKWAVGNSRGTDLRHVGRVPGFGRRGLRTGGTSTTVNSIRRHYGPSWRMIVSLEEPIRAWGGLPGGQSGHPGSAYYDRDVDAWVMGEYRELVFLNSPADEGDRITTRTVMDRAP